MSTNQSISLDYDDINVRTRLQEVQNKTQNLSPAFDLIGEYKLGEIDNQFRQEIDPFGSPWKKLSQITIQKKRQEGKILKILQRTGAMRASVNYRSTRQKLTIGLSDKKALKHQIGDGTPQRQILGITPQDNSIILEILTAYLNQLPKNN